MASIDRHVFLQSDEFRSLPQAMRALDIVSHVQGVLSADMFMCDHGLFVSYEREEDERQVRRALEQEGFPLLS